MYLSRVKINSSPSVYTRLFDIYFRHGLYGIHQLIWKLFSTDQGAKRDFLFRQEIESEQLSNISSRHGIPLFYVLSSKQPVPVEGLLDVDTKPYNPKIQSGMKLAFNIRVNPVIARRAEGKKNSVKHDIMMDAKKTAKENGVTNQKIVEQYMNKAVVQWFAAKAKKSGFKIENEESIEISRYRREHLKKYGANDIKFSSVDISGSLTVTESELFKKTLFSGIGHSRSFGCGLLLIRRL